MRTIQLEISNVPPCWIQAFGEDFDGTKFEDRDLFQALIAIRREIEQKGGKLLCQGSRRDVFPSAMSRSMGSGRKAYITRMGHPSNVRVDIFEDAEPDEVGTVDEQAEYHEKWFASLKQRSP